MQNSYPRIKIPVQIFFSIISIFWIIHVLKGIDWNITGESMSNLSIPWLTACLFSGVLIYSTRLFRLRYWVHGLSSKRLSIKKWIDLYLKSAAFGSITPARLGDFSRIGLIVKTDLNLALRSKIIFYDKIADLLYIPLGICLTSKTVAQTLNIPLGWIFTAGLLSLLAYLLFSFWFAGFLGFRAILAGWIITVPGLCLFILANSFLFWSVGINLAMLEVAAITLSAGIIASLPISVGGIGVREGSLIFFLGLWGIEPEATPPVLLLEFLVNMVFPVALYIFWILCINIKKYLA